MSKHTPGPWRVERQNASPTTGEWMIAGSKPGYLAEVRDCGSGDVSANARLIAAAPELYEVAQAIIDAMTASPSLHGVLLFGIAQRARAAIAKATGEQK